MKHLILCTLLLISHHSWSQQIPADKIRTDLDTLIEVLINIHPTFREHPNLTEVMQIRDTLTQSMSPHEFFILLQPLVSIDGHTTLQYTGKIFPELENPFFPFETVIFGDSLYVKNNLSGEPGLVKGSNILEINGRQTAEIIARMLDYVPGELKPNMIRRLDGKEFAIWYRLLYGNHDSFDIRYREGDRTALASVPGIGWESFTKTTKKNLDIQILEDGTAYMKVGKFRQPKIFLPFIDSCFTLLQQEQVSNLIIDKTSGGGFTNLADSLMQYITTRPFQSFQSQIIRISRETADYIREIQDSGSKAGEYYIVTRELASPPRKSNFFEGNVYILAGPTSYSAATIFIAMAKCYTDLTIVGEETGQPLISNAGLSRHALHHTGLNLYTSNSIFYMPCAVNDREGVKPDIEVPVTLDDLLNDQNRYLEFTIDLIQRTK